MQFLQASNHNFAHIILEVIQQLRGQNFVIFCPRYPAWTVYTLSMDKNRYFFTPSPLILSM